MPTIESLRDTIRQTVRDEVDYLRDTRYPEDILVELADQAVPVYTSDLIEVLASDSRLAFLDETIETDNVWDVLRQSIYSELYQAALAEWTAIEAEEVEG